MINFKDYIVEVANFPIPGVNFLDISPLLNNPAAFGASIDALAAACPEFDVLVAPDARGFIFGTPLALKTQKPFVMVRKSGKLPGKVISKSYSLEYGTSVLEVQSAFIKPGMRVVIVDDILATGGTINAIKALVEELGAKVVKMIFVIELTHLKGRKNIAMRSEDIVALGDY